MDQVRHVSTCDKVSLRLGTIVAVSSVLVHSVEKHATGVHGSCSEAHDVPWDVKSASLEQFLPSWTVRRQVWSDSLRQQHSGIWMDILLFSDINLSLIHHYRIHKCGLPHIAFRRNYMLRMRALLPLPADLPMDSVLSPVSTGPGSIRQAELVGESPRRTRRAKRRMWPVCVVGGSVADLPVLTLQDPSDVQGAMVYDCRPPLLPVSLQLSDIGPLPGLPTVVSATVAVPLQEDGLMISGVGSDGLVVPELGVAPLEDSGTDLEGELHTPVGSPSTDAAKPGMVVIPEVGPASWGIDLELARALLEVCVLPLMVTPIIHPVVETSVTPALYPVPPIPVMSDPQKGQRYTLLLDGGLIKGWGSKDSWLLIVCHDKTIISWHTIGCPPV